MNVMFYSVLSDNDKPIKIINTTATFKKGDNVELDENLYEVVKTNYVVFEEVILYVYVKPITNVKMFV